MGKPFIVSGEKGLKALPHWLKKQAVNTYSYSGSRIINLGWDYNPDSDWGRYDPRARIVVTDEALFEDACRVIEKAFGWRDGPASCAQ